MQITRWRYIENWLTFCLRWTKTSLSFAKGDEGGAIDILLRPHVFARPCVPDASEGLEVGPGHVDDVKLVQLFGAIPIKAKLQRWRKLVQSQSTKTKHEAWREEESTYIQNSIPGFRARDFPGRCAAASSTCPRWRGLSNRPLSARFCGNPCNDKTLAPPSPSAAAPSSSWLASCSAVRRQNEAFDLK